MAQTKEQKAALDALAKEFMGDENEALDENTKQIMEDHDLDEDQAERVQDIMDDYGVDEDEAVELEDIL